MSQKNVNKFVSNSAASKERTKTSFKQSQMHRLSTMQRTQSLNDPKIRLPNRRHTNLDFTNLSTTKLPDVEPAVPIDSFLHWRYMKQRGASNMAFDRVQHMLKNRAQNAIENFEKKLKNEADRLKKVNRFISNTNKEYQDTYAKLR